MTIYQTKICTKCNQSKQLDEFYGKRSKRSECKECTKQYQTTSLKWKNHRKSIKFKESQINRVLIKKYNITLEQYNKLYESQNGMCPGCLKHQLELKQRLSVEHDHNTGKVRGLMCSECNFILGKAKDNQDVLLRLVEYLKITSF